MAKRTRVEGGGYSTHDIILLHDMIIRTRCHLTHDYGIFQKTPATPEFHLASRGRAVDPRPSHTTALRSVGERTGADERFGERGPPGEGSPHSPACRIIANTWKSQCHCNSVCIIIIDSSACLLYTSPSPRDKRQSRMPSSA